MEPCDTIKAGNLLGECILWDDETQALWWTDIEGRRLCCFDWRSRSLASFATPERLCSFGFVAGSTRLIAAFESGFALYDPRSGAVDWLERLSIEGLRLNDGRVDRQGRFWAGGMAEREDAVGRAQLFCVDAEGRVHRRLGGLTISNGICWSPAGTTFYFTDSPGRVIWRYAFDPADGTLSGRANFAEALAGALPDGATVDAEGYLWSAQWGAGRIVRYAADGRPDLVLEVPASRPTCVTFAGPARDFLCVTTARHGLSEAALAGETGAGNVFVYNVGVQGLPEARYVFARGSQAGTAS
jgi:sugar lactone lactonase YvrE